MTRRATRLPSWIALAAVVAALAGCYHYAAVPLDRLEVGMEVRAQLSGSAVQRLRDGPDSVRALMDGFTVTGHVLRSGPDSLVLSVPHTLFEGDFRARVVTQDLRLARGDVRGTEVRGLDRRKTSLVALGAGIATFAIIQASRRGAGVSGGIPVIGGPPENRLPRVPSWLSP